jgi:hypothetical protein
MEELLGPGKRGAARTCCIASGAIGRFLVISGRGAGGLDDGTAGLCKRGLSRRLPDFITLATSASSSSTTTLASSSMLTIKSELITMLTTLPSELIAPNLNFSGIGVGTG